MNFVLASEYKIWTQSCHLYFTPSVFISLALNSTSLCWEENIEKLYFSGRTKWAVFYLNFQNFVDYHRKVLAYRRTRGKTALLRKGVYLYSIRVASAPLLLLNGRESWCNLNHLENTVRNLCSVLGSNEKYFTLLQKLNISALMNIESILMGKAAW